jgi:hypothetical protein
MTSPDGAEPLSAILLGLRGLFLLLLSRGLGGTGYGHEADRDFRLLAVLEG